MNDIKISEMQSLVYAAAALDYEGSIGINKTDKRIFGGRSDAPYYSIRVAITNTEVELIEYLYINFGGSFNPKVRQDIRSSNSFIWDVCGSKACIFLSKVNRFIKSERKKKLIELAFGLNNLRCREGKVRSKDIIDKQENIWKLAKELNKRGKRNNNKSFYDRYESSVKTKDNTWFGVPIKRII